MCPLTSIGVYGKSGVQDLKLKMKRDVNNTAALGSSPARVSYANSTQTEAWWHPPMVLPLFSAGIKAMSAVDSALAPVQSALQDVDDDDAEHNSPFGVLLARINQLEEKVARAHHLEQEVNSLRQDVTVLRKQLHAVYKVVNSTMRKKRRKIKWSAKE